MCCQGRTRPLCRSGDVFLGVTHFEWWIFGFYDFCWRCSLRSKSYVWCPWLGRIFVSFCWHFLEATKFMVKMMKLRKLKYLVLILMIGKIFLRLIGGGGHLVISHVHVQFWEIQFLNYKRPFFSRASFQSDILGSLRLGWLVMGGVFFILTILKLGLTPISLRLLKHPKRYHILLILTLTISLYIILFLLTLLLLLLEHHLPGQWAQILPYLHQTLLMLLLAHLLNGLLLLIALLLHHQLLDQCFLLFELFVQFLLSQDDLVLIIL